MKCYLILTIVTLCVIKLSTGVRLHKLFQFIDGYKAEHNLIGFLHIGREYAVFLHAPKPHDKFLVYELYEAKNSPTIDTTRPKLLAVSKVPVDYIKEQLKVYRTELYRAKYVNDNTVPGTQVMTLREWQIDRALHFHGGNGLMMQDKNPVLRSVM